MILVDACLVAEGNAGRHKDLYWFGLLGSIIPYVQFVVLVYLALVCSRDYKPARERLASQVSDISQKKACVWLDRSVLVRAAASENCLLLSHRREGVYMLR